MIATSKPSSLPGQDKLHVTETGKGVKVRADQPHLVSLGGGRLSTAVTLLPLEEGTTTLGSGDNQDVVVRGTGVRAAHCTIQYDDGILILTPNDAACLVTVDGSKVEGPTILSQGCMICIGRSNYFRFNHPEQAAQLKNILPANTRVSVVPLQFNSSYLKGRPRQAIGQPAAGIEHHLLPEECHEEEGPAATAAAAAASLAVPVDSAEEAVAPPAGGDWEQRDKDSDTQGSRRTGAAAAAVSAAASVPIGGGGAAASSAVVTRGGAAGGTEHSAVAALAAASTAACAATLSVSDDQRHRDRLAEESFSSKLKRFERLSSASLPAVVPAPSASAIGGGGGDCSSSDGYGMGPPGANSPGKGGGTGKGSSHQPAMQPVGYWGHVGEKVFTKHTVTTTVPLADLTGGKELPFGGSSSLGRHRSSAAATSGGSASSVTTLAGWPHATVPSSAAAAVASGGAAAASAVAAPGCGSPATRRASDDDHAAASSRCVRRPSDPLPSSVRSANVVSKYDEVFADDLPPEPRHLMNGGASGVSDDTAAIRDTVEVASGTSDSPGINTDMGLPADESLSRQHQRMVEERKLAEEAEEREQRRLEEILMLCAEYERQTECDLLATDGSSAVTSAETTATASASPAAYDMLQSVAGNGTRMRSNDTGTASSQGEGHRQPTGSSFDLAPLLLTGAAAPTNSCRDGASPDGSSSGSGTGSASVSKAGPCNAFPLSDSAIHDGDSGVGSSASLAGRDCRPAEFSGDVWHGSSATAARSVAATLSAATCSSSNTASDDDREASSRTDNGGGGGGGGGSYLVPKTSAAAEQLSAGGSSYTGCQPSIELHEECKAPGEEERIYDDPASLVVPPPLPPRNGKQPVVASGSASSGSATRSAVGTEERILINGDVFGKHGGGLADGGTPPASLVGSLQRHGPSAAGGSGSLRRDGSSWSSSSSTSCLLQRLLPTPPVSNLSGPPSSNPSDKMVAAVAYATDTLAISSGHYNATGSQQTREAPLAECPVAVPPAVSSWKPSRSEASPQRRPQQASSAVHSELDEAKSQLRKLRKCQSDAAHTLSALKRHILELERQQADAVNELDSEWSVLENEQKCELDQLNVQLQTNAHLKAKKLASLDRCAVQHEQDRAKLELSKRRLQELESRRLFIEKELRNVPEGQKGQHIFSMYVGELEAIDNQKKLLEDLDFKQMEVETRYEDERESVHRELSRQQAELQQAICAAEERLDGIAWRQRELLRATRGEVEEIERLRKGLVADFRKEKQRLVELDERAAELEQIVANCGHGYVDDDLLPAATAAGSISRFAEGGSSNTAFLASLASSRDGGSGGQMWSSPSNTMDRSVLAKLKADFDSRHNYNFCWPPADALVKDEQRKLRELKHAGFRNMAANAASTASPSDRTQSARNQKDGRQSHSPSHAGAQQQLQLQPPLPPQRDILPALSPGMASRADSLDEGTSLKGSEAAFSDGDVLSSGSADDVDRFLELQKLLAQARAHVQNVSETDRNLSAERKLRKDLERQLADEKEKRQQIVEEEVQLRERRRLAALSALERPLTRYLPVRVKEFDLRQHVELAGHNVEACPFVELDARTCRGHLLKMGSKSRTWNKRWFCFDRDKKALLYYGDRNDTRPRGVIYFQTIEDVFVDHMHTVKSPYHKLTFCVKTYERPYYLIAKTPETMSIWIDVIFSGAEGYLEF